MSDSRLTEADLRRGFQKLPSSMKVIPMTDAELDEHVRTLASLVSSRNNVNG